MSAAKGMVLVGGKTFRIIKRRPDEYEVYQVLDDAYLGTFSSGQGLPIQPQNGVDPILLRKIAMAALKIGKITWGRRPAPQ